MIINLTQHHPTPDQTGVTAPLCPDLITFTELPSQADLARRAKAVACLAAREWSDIQESARQYAEGSWEQMIIEAAEPTAMIGGAPYFMPHLERELKARGIQPVYSFTERKVVETTLPGGTVEKKSVFRHVGWVRA